MLFRRLSAIVFFIAVSTQADPSKLVIVGGGHVGLVTAVLAHQNAQKTGEELHITIYDKNAHITQTTAANIWNSHTPDEIVSVVPQGAEMGEKLKIPFDRPGGILVTDVAGVNDSPSARRFIEQVTLEGPNELAHRRRTELLLQLGRAGMAGWKQFFDNADGELQGILKSSNFDPCCENDGVCAAERFNGYRIDLIYKMENASEHAENMVRTYADLGYKKSELLSPDEVEARDPSLAHFCKTYSVNNQAGMRVWRNDASALWRPGGCLDTQRFLPQLANYLDKAMGTYQDEKGDTKSRFSIEFNKQVVGVNFEESKQDEVDIKSLVFADGSETKDSVDYKSVRYVIAPGESVGTLERLGFAEPAYAGFAGASLSLEIDIPKEQSRLFEDYNHYMEVHSRGTVLAWQGRKRDGKIFLGGAGTKAFYGDKVPGLDEDFARTKNLLQLQMFNDVVPQIVSLALGRDSAGERLSFADLDYLELKGIARRWVGRRAVAYDGFPVAGLLYHQGQKVANAQATTHLGSGGGSFSLIMTLISNYAVDPDSVREELASFGISDEIAQEVLRFADSRREAAGL